MNSDKSFKLKKKRKIEIVINECVTWFLMGGMYGKRKKKIIRRMKTRGKT